MVSLDVILTDNLQTRSPVRSTVAKTVIPLLQRLKQEGHRDRHRHKRNSFLWSLLYIVNTKIREEGNRKKNHS